MGAKLIALADLGTLSTDSAHPTPLSATRINTRQIIIQAADATETVNITDSEGNVIGQVRNLSAFTIPVSRHADRGGHHLNLADYGVWATDTNNDGLFISYETLS